MFMYTESNIKLTVFKQNHSGLAFIILDENLIIQYSLNSIRYINKATFITHLLSYNFFTCLTRV